jgi:hypothetical protein
VGKEIRDALGRALEKVKELLSPPGPLLPVPARPPRRR